jgi:hypothetical protein
MRHILSQVRFSLYILHLRHKSNIYNYTQHHTNRVNSLEKKL